MEKYEAIEALYERRSQLNLDIITLENTIAESMNKAQNLERLNELRNLHYQEFMIEFEIKAVLEQKPSAWSRLLKVMQ